MDDATAYVRHAPLPLAAGLSFVLGVLGFFSPCVMPLVPGYLSYLASVVGDGRGGRARGAATAAMLFVLGFSAIFVAEGVAFGALGTALRDHAVTVQRVLGVVTIAMGAVYLGFVPLAQGNIRARSVAGLAGAPLVGAAFGVAWGPCLTPAVSAIVSMAYEQSSAGRGALLSLFYCFGLGLPFVAAACGAATLISVADVVRRNRRAFRVVGGGLLILIGLALVTGRWNYSADWLRSNFS